MQEYDLDPQRQTQIRPPEETAAPVETATGRTLTGGRHEHLDTASVMHLQRTAGNEAVVQLLGADEEAAEDGSSVHDIVGKGGGQALDSGTRESMESKFGTDFSDVRVHTDSRAAESAASVRAQAYTVGSDIVVGSGGLNTASTTGQRMLAHELSHVVQQRQGPVDGTPAAGGIRLSDPSDRFERAADENADQIVSRIAEPSASTDAGEPVQRQAEGGEEEEEEPVQTLQRQAEGGEEEEEEPGPV